MNSTTISSFAALCNSATKRAQFITASQCQAIIDDMETRILHEELPAAYDWLIEQRDGLAACGLL